MDNLFNIPYELFSICTQRGFLPEINPLTQLPPTSTLNKKLNELATHLPALIKERYLRIELDKLNLIYAGERIILEEQHDMQNRITVLTLLMLAQAYVWENPENPADFIPAILAKNIYPHCKMHQRFPALSYSDYVLQNWQLKNPANDISLDNIEPIITFTNTPDEAWFIKIHVVIEKICGKALYAAYQIWHLAHSITNRIAKSHVIEKICIALHDIAASMSEALSILKRMVNGCHPEFFWSTLRHYLNGWEKVKITTKENKEETGVRLNDISQDKCRYKGASGAQSSIIPAIDAALGIKHEIDNMYQTMLTYRQYMPSQHSLFIHFLSSSKLEYVLGATCSPELIDAWKQAINKLKLFRLEHIQLVSQYIYYPAEKRGLSSHEITGTGGTSITDYLGNRYDNTHKSMMIYS